MTSYQKNPPHSSPTSSEQNKVFAPSRATTQGSEAIVQDNKVPNGPDFTIPGFLDLHPTVAFESVTASKPTSAITYLEVDQQRLLRICMSTKKASQEPLKHLLKAWFFNLDYGKLYINYYHFYE